MSHSIAWSPLFAAAACALAACPTVDLGEAPISPGACRPDPVYFRETVWPELVATADVERSCVGAANCHRQSDGRSALRFSTDEPIDFNANYEVATRFLDCGAPETSAFLTKPLAGLDPHGGGDLFAAGSPTEELFLAWFDQ
jgi:hypothetical protein